MRRWAGVLARASCSALRHTISRQPRMITPAAVSSTGPMSMSSNVGSKRAASSANTGPYRLSSRRLYALWSFLWDFPSAPVRPIAAST